MPTARQPNVPQRSAVYATLKPAASRTDFFRGLKKHVPRGNHIFATRNADQGMIKMATRAQELVQMPLTQQILDHAAIKNGLKEHLATSPQLFMEGIWL